MKKFIVFGILLFGICNIAYSKPVDDDDLEQMQSDDYYVEDDQSDPGVANKEVKPSKPTIGVSKAYFVKPNSTISGTPGKDITLECEVMNLQSNGVVLWYKGNNTVANDGSVLSPMYSVNGKTHQLTIIKATDSSQGEYFCLVLPEKIRLYTTVKLTREPFDVLVVPESSPSKQDDSGSGNGSGTPTISSLLILPLVCAIEFVLRI